MTYDLIQKMIDEYKNKVAEIQPQLQEIDELKHLLEGIEKHTGTSLNLPSMDLLFTKGKPDEIDASVQIKKIDIKPDTFHALNLPDAAEKFLNNFGHAMNLSTIYEALQRGGADIENKERLEEALTRSTRKFKKFGKGADVSFGLLAWYPEKKRIRRTPVISEESSEPTTSENATQEINNDIK